MAHEFYVGEVIGSTEGSSTKIENCVNMGKIIYETAHVDGLRYAYVGGIVGHAYICKSISVLNCASYAIITSTNQAEFTHVGGILGFLEPISGENFVSNCVNYGSIIIANSFEGHTSYVGGIVGYSFEAGCYIKHENNVNTGEFKGNNTDPKLFLGSISGNTYNAKTDRCFWTNRFGVDKAHGMIDGYATTKNTYEIELIRQSRMT